jgi:hypothetical protein
MMHAGLLLGRSFVEPARALPVPVSDGYKGPV